MRILITGGAGFIGSHLAETLVKQNHEVTVLDDLSNGRRSHLTAVSCCSKFEFVKGSVLDRSLLEKTLKGCDAVFHLAAVLGVKNTVENPLKVIEGNIDGTRNVLEMAFQRKIKVIFASTSEVYGKNPQLPFNENADRVLGPTSKHRWCYATAKALDEHMCFAYAKKGLPVTVVRYFNAYGPRAAATPYGGVIPKFIMAALQNEPIPVYGDGTQTRSFSYIDDTIHGTVLCLYPKFNHNVFNLGCDQPISIKGLAQKIKRLTHSSSPIHYIPFDKAYGPGFEDTQDRVPDLTNMRRMLNIDTNVDILTGLERTAKWYKDQLTLYGT